MEDKNQNKIDAVIDEVLESKRIKQSVKFLFKSTLGLVVTGVVIIILLVALGVIK